MTASTISKATLSTARIETLKAVFAALFIGLGLVYLAGFASIDAAHDAAHDTRHSQSFPCH